MKRYGIKLLLGLSAFGHVCSSGASSQGSAARVVESLKVTILSTMLADQGIGEWGFAALVEADGRRILFDTGARPNTVLENARSLKANLAEIRDVILSHNHGDHTGGLLTLRRELAREAPHALARAHVGRWIFWQRSLQPGWQAMSKVKADFESLGGSFVEYSEPVELFGGVWITGPVPRTWPERNYGMAGSVGQVQSPEGSVEDNIPEDQSLVIHTKQGLVVLSGCGHAGMINTLQYARKIVREARHWRFSPVSGKRGSPGLDREQTSRV